jgi:hypothetical protein
MINERRTARIGVRAKGRNDGQNVSNEGKRPTERDERQRGGADLRKN